MLETYRYDGNFSFNTPSYRESRNFIYFLEAIIFRFFQMVASSEEIFISSIVIGLFYYYFLGWLFKCWS